MRSEITLNRTKCEQLHDYYSLFLKRVFFDKQSDYFLQHGFTSAPDIETGTSSYHHKEKRFYG
ncbi:hypothetical protein [Dongshaea marina]|uniref:hypothetical protein n=1 Tax=Dongshaea marina TaxID=2047966 RepID=UPI00131F09D3|nr:hypothetical protein [Dongshaea marina]